MSDFFTQKQTEKLKENGWEIIAKDETKLRWFGSDWNEGWMHKVTDLLGVHPEGAGMDFLVVATRVVPQEGE
tara:strand:- start:46 stop:261 length:216 start_codon:yes stop_codon:yes gene_type:complete